MHFWTKKHWCLIHISLDFVFEGRNTPWRSCDAITTYRLFMLWPELSTVVHFIRTVQNLRNGEWWMDIPHKEAVIRVSFPCHDVIMHCLRHLISYAQLATVHMRICVPEAVFEGRDKLLHTTDTVGCHYFSLPFIPPCDTELHLGTLSLL